MSEELREFVVKELGRHHKENDVIFAVARRADLNWNEAKDLVEDVKLSQGTRIARRQSPLLLLVGIGTMIGGLLLSGFILVETLNGAIIIFLNLPIPYLGNLVYFCLGLAMIGGAAWGTGRAILDAIGQ